MGHDAFGGDHGPGGVSHAEVGAHAAVGPLGPADKLRALSSDCLISPFEMGEI